MGKIYAIPISQKRKLLLLFSITELFSLLQNALVCPGTLLSCVASRRSQVLPALPSRAAHLSAAALGLETEPPSEGQLLLPQDWGRVTAAPLCPMRTSEQAPGWYRRDFPQALIPREQGSRILAGQDDPALDLYLGPLCGQPGQWALESCLRGWMIKLVCRGPPRVRSCPDPVESPEEGEVKSHPTLLWVGLEQGTMWTWWDPGSPALWAREAVWCQCRQTCTHTRGTTLSHPQNRAHAVGTAWGPACLFGFPLNNEDCFFKIINWEP